MADDDDSYGGRDPEQDEESLLLRSEGSLEEVNCEKRLAGV